MSEQKTSSSTQGKNFSTKDIDKKLSIKDFVTINPNIGKGGQGKV